MGEQQKEGEKTKKSPPGTNTMRHKNKRRKSAPKEKKKGKKEGENNKKKEKKGIRNHKNYSYPKYNLIPTAKMYSSS